MSRLLSFLVAAALLLVGLAVPAPAQAARAADPIPTTTVLTIEGEHQGSGVSLTATVTSESGVPTGTVTFSGDVPTTTVPLDATGTAKLHHSDLKRTHTVTATFNGTNGYATSSDTQTKHTQDYIEWDPQPTVAWLGPNLRLTLTMATYLYDRDGEPMVGKWVEFTLVNKAPEFLGDDPPKFAVPVCEAMTDANGLATCKGKGFLFSVLSLLTQGAYATYRVGFFPTDAYTKLPVVRYR